MTLGKVNAITLNILDCRIGGACPFVIGRPV